MPILVSFDMGLLQELHAAASKKIRMYQDIREAYAFVNHKYNDAMFLGGIDSRQLIDHPDRDPCTIWILFPDEYKELVSKDPDCFLKALDLANLPDLPEPSP